MSKLFSERLYDQICVDCDSLSRILSDITEPENSRTINEAMGKIALVEENVHLLHGRFVSAEQELNALTGYVDNLEGFLVSILVVVKLPLTNNDVDQKKLGEIRAWLKEVDIDPHIELTGGYFLFMKEEDATLFKLAWGGK